MLMFEYAFAADRRYSHHQAVIFLHDRIEAKILGTHKCRLDYLFVHGDGPVRKRNKGIEISEKGCRAIYSALGKLNTASVDRLKPL